MVLFNTVKLLIGFHQKNGYHNFVINHVFESPASLPELLNLLHPLDSSIYTYTLTCEKEEQVKQIQKEAAQHGFIGKEVDTTRLTSEDVAEAIWKDAFISQLPNTACPEEKP